LLAASEFWFSAVKWVGVAYPAYLGMRLLRSKGAIAIAVGAPIDNRGPSRGIFLRCFLVAVTNPKGYLFFSAFLPQFIVPTQPLWGSTPCTIRVVGTVSSPSLTDYDSLGRRANTFLAFK
jgi:threonine/homoserine/homoserine lactone efflux protein